MNEPSNMVITRLSSVFIYIFYYRRNKKNPHCTVQEVHLFNIDKLKSKLCKMTIRKLLQCLIKGKKVVRF